MRILRAPGVLTVLALLAVQSVATAQGTVDRTKPPELGPPPRVSLPPIVTRQLANGLKLMRSEEHTSELQSRVELVCRLLLEKKSSARATMISPEVVKES